MNTILTDDEIATLMPNDDTPMSLGEAFYTQARAVEAAVLAKLAQQEPVAGVILSPILGGKTRAALVDEGDEQWHCANRGATRLYAHPAPQQADRQQVPDGWVNAVQKIAAENEVEPSFVTMVFDDLLPAFMADKDAAGYVTLPLDSLIESDSYGVHGSDFYRCRVCDGESGAGVLNKGISHASDCPLAAAPEAPAQDEKQCAHGAWIDCGICDKPQASAVDERAAFEAWVTNQGVALHYEGDGHYGNATVSRWWEAWQACAALAQKGGAA